MSPEVVSNSNKKTNISHRYIKYRNLRNIAINLLMTVAAAIGIFFLMDNYLHNTVQNSIKEEAKIKSQIWVNQYLSRINSVDKIFKTGEVSNSQKYQINNIKTNSDIFWI